METRLTDGVQYLVLHRNRVIALAALVAVLLFVFAAVASCRYLSRAPSEEKVAADIVFGGQLLAYAVWDGTPHAVFRTRKGVTVRLDHLRLDWISIGWPPRPAWQQTGYWESISAQPDLPASVGVSWRTGGGLHDHSELFGEISDPAIVAMEVRYEGAWHRFNVESPGYLLRLDGFFGVPESYRWLNEEGGIVWEEPGQPVSPDTTKDSTAAPLGLTTLTSSPVPVLVAVDPDLECAPGVGLEPPPVALSFESNRGDGPCVAWIDEYEDEDGFVLFVWFSGDDVPRAYQTPANATSFRLPPADYPPKQTTEGCPRAWSMQVDVRALVDGTVRIVSATAVDSHPFDCPTVEE